MADTARGTADSAAASAKAAEASARAEARSAEASEKIALLTRGTWKLYKLELRKERTSTVKAAVELRRLATQWSRLVAASDELYHAAEHHPHRYKGLTDEVRLLRAETHELARAIGDRLPVDARVNLDLVWHLSRPVFELHEHIVASGGSGEDRKRQRARMNEHIGRCRHAIWNAAHHMRESLDSEEDRREEGSYGRAWEEAMDAVNREVPIGMFDPPPVKPDENDRPV